MRRADGATFPQDYRELFADAYVAELAAFVAACAGEGRPGPASTTTAGPSRSGSPRARAPCRAARSRSGPTGLWSLSLAT